MKPVGAQDRWDDVRGIPLNGLAIHGTTIAADELVIMIDDWSNLSTTAARIAEHGGVIAGGVKRACVLRIRFPEGAVALTRMRAISEIAGILHAEANEIVTPDTATSAAPPNDTYYSSQWYLRSQNVGAIDAESAWIVQKGSSSVIVAVIDSGMRLDHPEFSGRVLPGYDFIDEDENPHSQAPHGNQVAGILGANTNNSFGFAGIDNACNILPIRGAGTKFDIIQSIDFAAEMGARVINMSFGYSPWGASISILEEVLAQARAAGSVLVASAGNDGANADIHYPAASSSVISVGASTKTGIRAGFSNFGMTLDFMAPGESIHTVAAGTLLDIKNPVPFWGTSAAAPMVSGIAALLLAERPDLAPSDVYALLEAGARDAIGDPQQDTLGWDQYYGHGIVHAGRSLEALCGCTGDEDFRGTPPGKLSATGRQWLTLNAGPDHAGAHYIVLGTFSGTSPGLPLGSLHVPLNQDHYFYVSSHQPSPLIRGPIGRLDEDGRARAVLALPTSLPPVLVGATLHHAYVLLEGGKPVYVSSPVAAQIGG